MNIFKNMEYIKNLLRIIQRKNNLRGEQLAYSNMQK